MLILIAVLYHKNEFVTNEHYHWGHQENWLLTSYMNKMPFIIAIFCSNQKKIIHIPATNHFHYFM